MADVDVKMQTVPGPGLCSGGWFEAKFQVIPVYITCPLEFRQSFTGVKILESINILGAIHLGLPLTLMFFQLVFRLCDETHVTAIPSVTRKPLTSRTGLCVESWRTALPLRPNTRG